MIVEAIKNDKVPTFNGTFRIFKGQPYTVSYEKVLPLINNENETNKSHPYQGEFRTAELNTELLNYALASDNNFSKRLNKNLVISCMDQYPIDVDKLLSELHFGFRNVYISKGDSLTNIEKYK
jgi:hypothetical protein